MNGTKTLQALADLALGTDGSVPSPCVSVCRIDPTSGLCLGCWRSIDEIVAWGRMDDAGKRLVWQAILARMGTPSVRDPSVQP